jgi:hypothetical protein
MMAEAEGVEVGDAAAPEQPQPTERQEGRCRKYLASVEISTETLTLFQTG